VWLSVREKNLKGDRAVKDGQSKTVRVVANIPTDLHEKVKARSKELKLSIGKYIEKSLEDELVNIQPEEALEMYKVETNDVNALNFILQVQFSNGRWHIRPMFSVPYHKEIDLLSGL